MLQSLAQARVPVVAAGHLDQRLDRRLSAKIAIYHERRVVEMLGELAATGSKYRALVGAEYRDENSWSSRIRDGYLAWIVDRGLEPVVRALPPSPTTRSFMLC